MVIFRKVYICLYLFSLFGRVLKYLDQRERRLS